MKKTNVGICEHDDNDKEGKNVNQNDKDKEGKNMNQKTNNSKEGKNMNQEITKKTSSKDTSKKTTKTSTAKTTTKATAKTTATKTTAKDLNGLLDPSERNVPGRNLADDYAVATGKYKKVRCSTIIAASDYLHQPTALAVEKMISHFDARLVEPPKVVKKGSMYELVDGVKTYTALCEMHKRLGIEEFDIMCRVYDNLTIEDQARIYAKQDEQHSNLPMGYKIRALEVAKDPEILDFLAVTRQSGFEIKPGDGRPRNCFIAATCTALTAYRYLGAKQYLRMLKMIYRTWAGESWSVTKHMLMGMAGFLKANEVDINAFARMFRHVTYEEIWARAQMLSGMTVDGAFTSAIADLYDELPMPDQIKAAV